MLNPRENELITRVGPGTPMGDLYRRFWLPVLVADELPEPDCVPVRLTVLGEKLVAFKDSTGRVGVLDDPRVAPVLLDAATPGKEILHPVAVTIFGGLISATLLDAFVTPVLFLKFGRKPLERLCGAAHGPTPAPDAKAAESY